MGQHLYIRGHVQVLAWCHFVTIMCAKETALVSENTITEFSCLDLQMIYHTNCCSPSSASKMQLQKDKKLLCYDSRTEAKQYQFKKIKTNKT